VRGGYVVDNGDWYDDYCPPPALPPRSRPLHPSSMDARYDGMFHHDMKPAPLFHQGSILQSSVSAENVSGLIFILKFRTNLHQKNVT
jgi:hypothetical protein